MFDQFFGTNTIWCKRAGEESRSAAEPYRQVLLCTNLSLHQLSLRWMVACAWFFSQCSPPEEQSQHYILTYIHYLAALLVLIIQTSFWCWYCTKEAVNGSCSRVAISSGFGMNKRRGSICLAVGRHDGGDKMRDLSSLLVLNGTLMNHIHTRRDAGISFWLSGGARVVFPQAQSELKKIESVPANKKWNTTVCLSCIAINLKFYRALMEAIKTVSVCVLEFLYMRVLTSI